MIALALAPLSDSMMTKFFRPIVKGLMTCSAYYPNVRIIRRAKCKTCFCPQEQESVQLCERGAKASTIVMSLIETAKANDADPYLYVSPGGDV